MRPLVVLLVTMCLAPAAVACAATEAPVSPDSAASTSRTLALDVDGREIRVAVPGGMGQSDEMRALYEAFTRLPNAELRLLFWPDSLSAVFRAVHEGRMPADRPLPMPTTFAGVGVWTGDMAMSAEEFRAVVRYEAKDPEKSMLRRSSDAALRRQVRDLLARDPEGREDLPLPIDVGRRAGLESICVGDSVSLWLWAYTLAIQGPAGVMPVTMMQGVGSMVVRDRVLLMFLSIGVQPSTGAAVRLRRAFRGWIEATLAANDRPMTPPSAPAAERAASPKSTPH